MREKLVEALGDEARFDDLIRTTHYATRFALKNGDDRVTDVVIRHLRHILPSMGAEDVDFLRRRITAACRRNRGGLRGGAVASVAGTWGPIRCALLLPRCCRAAPRPTLSAMTWPGPLP